MKIVETYGNPDNLTGEINESSVVIQSFLAQGTVLSSFSIMFATYMRRNLSILNVEIMDHSGFVHFKSRINCAQVIDNKYHDVSCDAFLIKDKRYFLKISCAKPLGKSVTGKWGYKVHYDEIMCINNVEKRGELCCSFSFGDGVAPINSNVPAVVMTKDIGLISVIVPVYNSMNTLPKLLESLALQTYNNFELIVVDDGSRDTDKVMALVVAANVGVSQPKVLLNPANVGACFSRNSGFEYATGEFTFFCDADVVLKKHCLEHHVQTLHSHPDCTWSYSNFMVGKEKRSFWEFNSKKMKQLNCSSTMSMIRTDAHPHFNEQIKRLQDWEMFLSLMDKGHKGCWINEDLFFAHDTAGITKNSISWEDAVAEVKKFHPTVGT